MKPGYFYQEHNKFSKADSVFRSILKDDPDYLNAHYQTGRTAVFSGNRLREGINHLKLFISMQKENKNNIFSVHWRIGIIYEKMGIRDSALVEYQTALRFNPKNKEALKAVSKLTRYNFFKLCHNRVKRNLSVNNTLFTVSSYKK